MLGRKGFVSLAIALGLAAMPALAEDQHHPAAPGVGMTGQTPMMGNAQMMIGQYGMKGMQMMAQHVEGRIAFLKTELKITDAQLPQWNAFAQAMRDNATAMRSIQGMTMGMSQGGKLPDTLAAQEKVLADRLEAIRKLKAAANPLYAVLSDDQKKSADELMISPMGMMMGMGMM